MKNETNFRTNSVTPFLKTLENASYFPIQQKTIRGDADFIACIRGHFVWLELKTDVGVEDPLQKYKASCVDTSGGITLVAKPKNWKAVKLFLKLLDRGIYDKNVLRAIKLNEFPKGYPEIDEHTNEEPRSVQDQAHRKSTSKASNRNDGEIPQADSIPVRQRRGRKQRASK